MTMRAAWAGVFAPLLLGLAALRSQDTPALVERLAATDARVCSDAYQELQRLRPPDAPELLGRRLPSMPLLGQSYGMYLLQMYRAEESQPVYRRLLAAGGPFLRGASAAALWRAGDRAAGEALAAAIGACADLERSYLLGRLWGVDDPRVRAAVREVVRPGAGPTALEDALYFLLDSGQRRDEAAVQAARAVLADASAADRERAACAAFLLALGDEDHGDTLAAVLAADDAAVARLRRFLDRAPRIGAAVEDALARRVLAARSEYEVSWPAQALARHAEDKAIAALRELLQSGLEPVRRTALEALAAIPRGLQPAELRSMLMAADPATMLVAADAMRRTDDLSALDRVSELADKPGPHRLAAVRVLGQFRARAAVPALLAALAADDPRVRQEAFTGLGRVLPALFPYRRLDLGTLGWSADAPAAQRDAAVAKLRVWWEAR